MKRNEGNEEKEGSAAEGNALRLNGLQPSIVMQL